MPVHLFSATLRPFSSDSRVYTYMSCAAYLTDLSQQIWNDIGQPTDMPVSYIQSKLVSAAFLGKLNSLTANCFTVTTGDISPPLGTDEQAIYAAMYETDFYTRKANALLNGTDIDWISIQDGDGRIVRSSTLDKARLYRDLQKEQYLQLKNLVAAYRQDNANGRSVDFFDIDNGWRTAFSNDGFGMVQGGS